MQKCLSILLLFLAACAFVPNATVRVALPPGDAVAADWAALGVSADLVAPDAFPPPDLVWFEGEASNNPAARERALGANAQVEALGRSAGLAAQWFAVEGERILPLAVQGTRVKGLWWNEAGWNRERVPELLSQLWSKKAQAVWARRPGWTPAIEATGPAAKVILLVR